VARRTLLFVFIAICASVTNGSLLLGVAVVTSSRPAVMVGKEIGAIVQLITSDRTLPQGVVRLPIVGC